MVLRFLLQMIRDGQPQSKLSSCAVFEHEVHSNKAAEI